MFVCISHLYTVRINTGTSYSPSAHLCNFKLRRYILFAAGRPFVAAYFCRILCRLLVKRGIAECGMRKEYTYRSNSGVNLRTELRYIDACCTTVWMSDQIRYWFIKS